ncbi:MAG: hypothetical protein HYT78_19685 [Deltaproteobacteria bacterium]|nr:hypothetical protein [Deltaproteobacteria bacterium]
MQMITRKSYLAHVLAWACITMAGFYLPLHDHLDSPPGKADLIPVVKIKQVPRYEHNGEFAPPLASSVTNWVPAPHVSILRFDFKQNLRLWPVVASGITRSPPLA